MKGLTGMFFLLVFALSTRAQYYYRDILVTKQTMQKWALFKENRVKKVNLSSFERTGEPTPGFDCNQVVSDDYLVIYTYTQTNMSNPTSLIAYYDTRGFLRKTIDTSDTYQSTTEYDYDGAGRIITVSNNALQTDNLVRNSEIHEWKYKPDGAPLSMIKIKNGSDTTSVSFALDAKGNVIEEHPTSNRLSLPTTYYYYDSSNSLTDLVRFNEKANRLLPDYIFERNNRGQLKAMLFLPAGTNQYRNGYMNIMRMDWKKRKAAITGKMNCWERLNTSMIFEKAERRTQNAERGTRKAVSYFKSG